MPVLERHGSFGELGEQVVLVLEQSGIDSSDEDAIKITASKGKLTRDIVFLFSKKFLKNLFLQLKDTELDLYSHLKSQFLLLFFPAQDVSAGIPPEDDFDELYFQKP